METRYIMLLIWVYIFTGKVDVTRGFIEKVENLFLRNSRDAERWTCNDCLFHVLPFKNYDDTIDETLAVNVIPKNINTHHKESLKHHHRHISIAHLNTQSLASTFDVFHLMLENHKFDIVALNETWLKDNKHQYKYVQIPGYNTVLWNRENKKGGGVSFYVKTTWVLHSEMTSRKWTIQLKLFGLKFAEKIRTLLFLSVHFTNLVPMRKKSNVGWKSLII